MGTYAIVGLACLFPGAGSPDDYWQNLIGGVDSRTEGGSPVFGPGPEAAETDPEDRHRIYCTRGGFVEEFTFDPEGLLLAPEYVAGLDRSFHWALQVARDALGDAGPSGGAAARRRTGLVFGNYPFPTPGSARLADGLWESAVAHGLTEAGLPASVGPRPGEAGATVFDGGPAAAHNLWAGGAPAQVTAAALGLGGPRYTLDAACSSALYALRLACGYLAAGRADVMLAGGVCAPDPTTIHLSFSDLRAYAQDGFSQPFDARSTGIVTGQGAAMMAVKRLADARRDGDRVYAVIDGVALTNDGAGKHLLAPNVAGQTASYALAHEQAGVDPATVRYLECHATGTPLGDRTELQGIADYFGAADGNGALPLLGSVKSNLGHLLTVAGMSSLIKVVLSLNHGTIPPTIGMREPLPGTPADRVVTEATPWPAGEPRRAGVSAFGFGGTNAHVLLSAPDGAPGTGAQPESGPPDDSGLPRLAVFGMGAHFGDLSSLHAFERAGYDGTRTLRELPEGRWRGFETVPDGPLARAGLAGPDTPRGGYLESFEVDATTYRIPPKELEDFNQQHLVMMRVAEEALRDAGYERPRPGQGGREARRVGVVLAMEMEPSAHGHGARYGLGNSLREWCAAAGGRLTDEQLAELTRAARNGIHDSIEPNEVLSYIGNIMASRISSLWNFTGPSFTVSGDSAGGAYALEAARLLLADESVEAVLVGGVDLAAGPENTLARELLEPGSVSGGTTVLGEGAGAVVVSRPEAVPADRTVYAHLSGLAVRHPGEPAVDHAVRPELVADVAEEALREAGLSPADVELVDAHHAAAGHRDGAGELTGLARVWSAERTGELRTALSGVSASVGHTGCASVLAGVIRAALCLHHAYFPVAPDGADAGPLDGSGFHFAAESRPWLRERRTGRRAASVSVTGTTGTHAHLVLTGDRVRGDVAPCDWSRSGGSLVVPVGAPDMAELTRRLNTLADALAEGGDPAGPIRRAVDEAGGSPLKAVLVADDREGLVRQLRKAAEDLPEVYRGGGRWTTPSGSCFTSEPVGSGGRVALVFPGAFNSYLGLGRQLFRAFPGLLPRFEEQAERPAELLRAHALYPRTLRPLQRRDLMRMEGELTEDIPLMLAAGTSFALLATDLVRDLLGVRVDGAFGYSLGESSMLFATGGWHKSARTDRKISASPLFDDMLCGPKRTVRELWDLGDDVPDAQVWGTYVLLCEAERVRRTLERPEYDRVFLTHVNTPHEVVVAGDPAQCRDLVAVLDCRSARAPANHVMHCPVVDGVLEELAELNNYPTGDVGDLVLYSSRHYAPVTDFEPGTVAGNIAITLRETVDFPRLVRRAYADGFRCFIEVGPSSTCTRWVEETLGSAPHLSVSVDRRGARGAADVARLVAQLAAHGVEVDLTPFVPAAESAGRSLGLRSFPVGGLPVAPRVASTVAGLAEGLRDSLTAGSAEPVSAPPSAGAAPTPAGTAPSPAGTAPATDGGRQHERSRPAPTSATTATEWDTKMPSRPAEHSVPALVLAREPLTMLPAVAPRDEPEPPDDHVPTADSRTPGQSPTVPQSATTPAPAPARTEDLLAEMLAAHRSVLRRQEDMREQLAALLGTGQGPETDTPGTGTDTPGAGHTPDVRPGTPPGKEPRPKVRPAGVVWDEADLLEFATGKIGNVFGERYAEIDGYRRRVRLPAPPYLFATRVTELQAETGTFEPSFIRTEYDVPRDAWYAVDGQVPPAVTIEAGQCDLLLISYLGADFQNRGDRVYRLLDSTLSFVGDLPRVGQTLRYDVWIDQFVRQGDTLLFFFHYDCYADGELILKLTNACAGFFTDEELENSLGVIEGKAAAGAAAGTTRPRPFRPLARTERASLGSDDLALLAEGRIADVFGPEHRQPEGSNPSLRLPDAKLRMVDEVTLLDRTGGAHGLGRIEAVKDLVPDGWYFECHFTDDPVLAGSLVAEGAVQLLQTYAFSLGLHHCLPDARFQPVPGQETEVKVRGQITPSCSRIEYRVDVTEVTLLPRPAVVADVTVLRDGKAAVGIRGLAIRLREKPGTPYRPEAGGRVPHFLGRTGPSGRPAMLSEFHMAHAAKGDLAVAMGPEFEVYAHSRAPYIPNGDFLFVDRVMELEGERGALKPGAVMVTEYDVPGDAWYYGDNPHRYMPNCVYMESSLQAAILLGYYLGATLPFPDEQFSIRNLDGRATLHRDIDLRGRTVQHRSKLLSHDSLPGSILQNFSYELSCDGEVFYTGESLFGYFTDKALANQVGLDKGTHVLPWLDQQPARPAGTRRIDLPAYRSSEAGRTATRLAGGQLDLVEWVDVLPEGGKHGRGYLRGHRTIDPANWYFECHFHRDPVMPGSLGVEAVLQALQVYAVETGLTDGLRAPRFALSTGTQTSWSYRGQILRTDPDMEFDAHVKEVRREPGRLVLVADASLWKSTLRIYELRDLSIEIHHDQ